MAQYSYEIVRNHILSMDPLTGVNRAYYILSQVEKQKQVTEVLNMATDFAAYKVIQSNASAVSKPTHK